MSEEPLDLCAAGVISPEVALARLLLLGASPDDIAGMLAKRSGLVEVRRLFMAKRAALGRLAAEVAGGISDHAALASPSGGPAAIGAFFDRAVAHSPEASVALYSLADPAILAAATEEIVTWLRSHGLLGGDVLDLGCGIGRVAARLAGECSSVLGLDVSLGMIAEARRRHGDLPRARFEITTGETLEAIGTDSVDLVLAIDSFPYVVQVGDHVARAHIEGAARALRHAGTLVVLNLSYRGDDALDASDLTRWIEATGLVIAEQATRPFSLWDGVAYRLRKP